MQRSNLIRVYLLRMIPKHPHDIVRVTCQYFNVSRQVVNRYLRELRDLGLVEAVGNTKQRTYTLASLVNEVFSYDLSPDLAEDEVWREKVKPLLTGATLIPSENVINICLYGFTEMLNNAIDHSEGTKVYIVIRYTVECILMLIWDDGVGIFNKIVRDCHLEDEQHAILELAKGKLTTDPARHTGQGIFFTSRVFDHFVIFSDGQCFTHSSDLDNWLTKEELAHMMKNFIEPEAAKALSDSPGTIILMRINPVATHTIKEVFDRFSSDDEDYDFSRTNVPVSLARFSGDQLVSRSQAKRLLARLDKFKEVTLDFKDVSSIGQAFADEIFRVFLIHQPGVNITYINANEDVERMIRRAIHARNEQASG